MTAHDVEGVQRWGGWPAIQVEGYEKTRSDIRPKALVDPDARRSDQSLLLMTREEYVPASALAEAQKERDEAEAGEESMEAQRGQVMDRCLAAEKQLADLYQQVGGVVDELMQLGDDCSKQEDFTEAGRAYHNAAKLLRESLLVLEQQRVEAGSSAESSSEKAPSGPSLSPRASVASSPQPDQQVGAGGDLDRGISEEELQAAREWADRMEAEGKLPGIEVVEPPENLLRVIWREPGGKRRRCSTFIPIPESVSEHFRAGLAAAFPRFTAYTYPEAERMVRGERKQTTATQPDLVEEEGQG